ncbi:MAG: ferrochelatase, partial [Bacillota bacterium]
MSKEKMGLLVMAYGAPYNEGDIERFYTHISGGRKPSKEAVSALTKKYGTIGGISPLAEITKKQANALRDKLNERQGQLEFSLYIGLKHIEPYIEDAVVQMKKDGIKEAVSIVLTPHYSKYGVNTYIARAVGKAKEIGGLTIHAIKQWHNEPGFIDYWVNEIKKIYEKMSNEDKEGTMLIMSAHSLPKHFVQNDD